jgi:NAD(P)-dependent dehydrogenase (short-subunit alcohol dehydrogenase family)
MAAQFEGKTALITGGGTGIGRASAVALAAEGCSVTVCGRTTSTLEETVGLVKAAGGTASSVRCDVSDEAAVRAAVEAARGDDGRLDFGVNCAGVSGGGELQPTAEYATEKFDLMFATDLRGTFLAMKYELRQMKAQGFGSIVNIASITGLVGYPGVSGYVAAKHGQIGLTKAAALDYATDGIRVNAIASGLVDTPLIADRPPDVLAARIALHPLGRLAQPNEIADAAVWLCSDRSSFVTGAAITVDSGWTAR